MPENKSILSSLPCVSKLPDGREVILQHMSKKYEHEAYAMFKLASTKGEGYGQEEIRSLKDYKDRYIENTGHHFVCLDREKGLLLAQFGLLISTFYRGNKMADPYMVVGTSERSNGLGEWLLRQSISYACDKSFLGLYADAFSNNKPVHRIMDKIGGFVKCGFLPIGGVINGKNEGLNLYYFDLRKIQCLNENDTVSIKSKL